MLHHATLARQDRLQHWKPQIDRALKAAGTTTFQDLVDGVKGGSLFLFDNGEAFVLAQPQFWPGTAIVHVLVGGGSQAGLEKLENVVTIFGKNLGAKKLTFLGRPGFVRRVKKQGWKTPMAYMEKLL